MTWTGVAGSEFKEKEKEKAKGKKKQFHNLKSGKIPIVFNVWVGKRKWNDSYSSHNRQSTTAPPKIAHEITDNLVLFKHNVYIKIKLLASIVETDPIRYALQNWDSTI